ncbi:MAG: 4-hydroxy-3-methylbut-2-enyl diphosphate reductase [Alphaproteobacteria bacterium]|nr:MAG: 4-hydroxy-3-methylbut-2-enyl diphosphate reductase [Alphaproteobacteria bacterium]
MHVILAQPRGFCAGVERAIAIVEMALDKFGPPVYVRHEIVHNRHVVDRLRAKGAIFVDQCDEIPAGSVTIFSAHGVSDAVVGEADQRGLEVYDATCPLVQKVHREGQLWVKQGREVILIGHEGHPEVEGTLGRIHGKVHLVSTVQDIQNLEVSDPENLAYVTQTTLSMDDTRAVVEALFQRFPHIVGPATKDICYATQNRQNAVRAMGEQVNVMLVVGAPNSSNSNRLRELAAEAHGIPSYLVEDKNQLKPEWIKGHQKVGVTAGASAPEDLVQGVVDELRRLAESWGESFEVSVLDGIEENVHFNLPTALTKAEHRRAA